MQNKDNVNKYNNRLTGKYIYLYKLKFNNNNEIINIWVNNYIRFICLRIILNLAILPSQYL